jgi:hypothetical protein
MSVLPHFVEAHHTTAVDVKEDVIRAASEGDSLSTVAKRSSDYAGGCYAEKTLRRWRQCWEARRQRQAMRLWGDLLHQGWDEALPRERKSAWRALFAVWHKGSRGESLLAALLRLDRSPGLSPG